MSEIRQVQEAVERATARAGEAGAEVHHHEPIQAVECERLTLGGVMSALGEAGRGKGAGQVSAAIYQLRKRPGEALVILRARDLATVLDRVAGQAEQAEPDA